MALAIVVDGLAGLLTYRRAQVSTSLLLDYQLQQMALSLRAQGAAAPDAPISLQGDASDFEIQIWNKDGAPVYSSPSPVQFPHRVADGYSDLEIGRSRWRVFTIETPRRIILVAQLSVIRERLARSVALKTIAPLLLLTPLLAVAIWLIVVRTMEPIKRVVSEVRSRDADTLRPLASAGLPYEIEPLVAEVNRLLERLSTALQMQRSFIADAAHELRSPLTALSLQIQLFSGAQDERAREEIRVKLVAAMARARNLVQQLLTLARSEPGAAMAEVGQLNLSGIVREAISECASYSISRRTDLAFETDSEVEMVGDADSLRVLVRNLVDNAVRYTPPDGKVLVRLSESRTEATLEVEDSGPGLPEAERERVFDRFYRGADSAEGGTGLGLAIVKSIALRHRGVVKLSRAPMGGLRATFILPKYALTRST